MKLLNKAVGMVVSVLGGMLAQALFKKIWQTATGDEEAPKPTDARRGWGEILLAAALQGAIFAVVQAVLDRGTAEGTSKLTGVWPGDDADDQSDAGHQSKDGAGDRSGKAALRRSVRANGFEFLYLTGGGVSLRVHGEARTLAAAAAFCPTRNTSPPWPCSPAPATGTARPSPGKAPCSRHRSADAMTFVYTTNLSEVRVLAETQAREAGLAEDRVIDFVIAVSEVAANTVRHAHSPGSMEIWSSAGQIVCEMRDSGVIADPLAVGRQPPAADASGGHGLWLVHQICDKVELHSNSGGTTIRLYMSLSAPGPEASDSPDPNGAAASPDVAL